MQCNYGSKHKESAEAIESSVPKEAVCRCGCKLVKWLIAEERRREAEAEPIVPFPGYETEQTSESEERRAQGF